jgi:hypothetical protein
MRLIQPFAWYFYTRLHAPISNAQFPSDLFQSGGDVLFIIFLSSCLLSFRVNFDPSKYVESLLKEVRLEDCDWAFLLLDLLSFDWVDRRREEREKGMMDVEAYIGWRGVTYCS